MTTEREINWAAPVVGKLEVGKTYVDRKGVAHTVECRGERPFSFCSRGNSYTSQGAYSVSTDMRHVLDLIAEYTPPAPIERLVMIFPDGDLSCILWTQNEILSAFSSASKTGSKIWQAKITLLEEVKP